LYDEAGLTSDIITGTALQWPLRILELLISNDEQAKESLDKGHIVETLSEILIMYGWGDKPPQHNAAMVMKTSSRILTILMVRKEAQNKFIGSTKPVISLLNIMRDQCRFESEVDRTEFITNGLKTLKLLSSEKENA